MKCKYIKENGEVCRASAMKGAEYCYLHNPEVAEDIKQKGFSKGGKGNAHKAFNLAEIEVETVQDVPKLLIRTISEVRNGAVEVRIANCIGYLAGHLLKAFEISELEKRIEMLEKSIKK